MQHSATGRRQGRHSFLQFLYQRAVSNRPRGLHFPPDGTLGQLSHKGAKSVQAARHRPHTASAGGVNIGFASDVGKACPVLLPSWEPPVILDKTERAGRRSSHGSPSPTNTRTSQGEFYFILLARHVLILDARCSAPNDTSYAQRGVFRRARAAFTALERTLISTHNPLPLMQTQRGQDGPRCEMSARPSQFYGFEADFAVRGPSRESPTEAPRPRSPTSTFPFGPVSVLQDV